MPPGMPGHGERPPPGSKNGKRKNQRSERHGAAWQGKEHPTMKIKICQLLCPERHCILAMLYGPYMSARKIEAQLTAAMLEINIDHRCGICDATDLRYEHAT